jgi:hypothetical protein
MIVRPVFYTATDSKGNKYEIAIEAYIYSCLGMGFVESNLPSQPKTVTELWDLRQNGFIIQETNPVQYSGEGVTRPRQKAVKQCL